MVNAAAVASLEQKLDAFWDHFKTRLNAENTGYTSWKPGRRNEPPSQKAAREYAERQHSIFRAYLEPRRGQLIQLLKKLHRANGGALTERAEQIWRLTFTLGNQPFEPFVPVEKLLSTHSPMTPNLITPFLPFTRPYLFRFGDDPGFVQHLAGKAYGVRGEHLPLFDAIGWQCDLAFCDLRRSTNPALEASAIRRRLSVRGEAVFLFHHDQLAAFGDLRVPHFRRHASNPALKDFGQHVWLVVDTGETAIVFFAVSHHGDLPHFVQSADAEAMADAARRRPVLREGVSISAGQYIHRTVLTGYQAVQLQIRRATVAATEGVPTWQAALREDEHPCNVRIEGGEFRVWLDAYQQHLAAVSPGNSPLVGLARLSRRSPHAALIDGSLRTLLLNAVQDERIRLEPGLRERIEQAREDNRRMRAPYYPLSPRQRLAWLDECDTILCRRDGYGFKAGTRYPVRLRTAATKTEHRRPNILGEDEDVILHGKELCVTVTRDEVNRHEFIDVPKRGIVVEERIVGGTLPERHALATLIAHFEIPEVPDVATLNPEGHERALAALQIVETDIRSRLPDFEFRAFQRADLARFTLHAGGVLGWAPGGGKTLAIYTLHRLYGELDGKPSLTLIVAPEGLHEQIRTEGREKFGVEVKPLLSQADLLADPVLKAALLAQRNGQPTTGTGLWITSYTALGFNGADEWEQDDDEVSSKVLKVRQTLPGYVPSIHDGGIGHTREDVKCVMLPSLATLAADVFDAVLCDEGVRAKSDDSFVALGIRTMRPRHPVLLTGTPVKNRLEDIFWLAHWASGSPKEGNGRFPYPATSAARNTFGNDHMIVEENLTRAAKYAMEHKGAQKTFKIRLPRCTNIHQLWRLLTPCVLRRKKQDFGADLVPKTVHPVRVLPGKAQRAVYGWHIKHPPIFTKAKKGGESKAMSQVAQLLAQLNNLRMAAACPDSKDLRRDGCTSSASWTDMTPEVVGSLKLIEERLSQGRQVVVMTSFQRESDTIFARLTEAGVSCILLDGRTSAKDRGKLAAQFKRKRFSVLVASDASMGEGHSFDTCYDLIRTSLHWAMDVNMQVEDRVHRLTSKEPVNIYCLITAGTIAERLFSLYQEKSASSATALDGAATDVLAEDTEEVNLGKLLREAIEGFDESGAAIDEAKLEEQWPDLRTKLRHSESVFRQWHPPIVADSEGYKPTKKQVQQAVIDATGEELNTSPLAGTIRNLPAASLGVLLGTARPDVIEARRRQFLAYAGQRPHITDWKQLWRPFAEALPPLPVAAPPPPKPKAIVNIQVDAETLKKALGQIQDDLI